MKIIAGEFKGRIIQWPRHIRPTSDKVREALFEILKSRIQGALFLDFYSGSGAIGIEALSRGARGVIFVDNDLNCLSGLRKNLVSLGISDLSMVDIYNKDAITAVKLLKKKNILFDIIFIDPPYHNGMAKKTLIEIEGCDILSQNGIIIAEVYKKEILPEEIGLLKKIRAYKYGDTILEFFGK